MKRVRMAILLFTVISATTITASADIVNIDFDGPEYVAGEQPPLPWFEEWDNTLHTVEADVGYLGTQALVVRYYDGAGRGVVYELPTPLTSAMGAVSVSILFNPQGLP